LQICNRLPQRKAMYELSKRTEHCCAALVKMALHDDQAEAHSETQIKARHEVRPAPCNGKTEARDSEPARRHAALRNMLGMAGKVAVGGMIIGGGPAAIAGKGAMAIVTRAVAGGLVGGIAGAGIRFVRKFRGERAQL
jgi:hypothetical protein